VEEKVRADPYDTLRPLPSLSWGTVDSIARYSLSLPPDHLVRARAALLEAFAKASQSGHTARAKLNLVRDTALLLQTGEFRARDAQKPAEAALAKAESEGVVVNYPPPGDADALFDVVRGDEKRRAKLVTPKPATNRTSAVHRGDDRYQLGRVYKDEIAIANAVRWRTPRPHDASEGAEEAAASRQQQADDAAAAAAEVELDLEDGIELSEEQRLAVAKAQSGRLLVLTGGPGTGKTYAVRQIVREWRRRNKKVVLACPTARAASVLSEAVGQSASTIHRLLEYNPQEERYKRDQNNQLDADALVIDEASMLDLKLAARLLEATPETCSLLFVGDKDQLPSVGAGAVLHDLLRSPRVPRVELETVFRLESDAGAIALNAQRINSGVVPLKLERGQALKEKLKGEKRPAGCVFIPRKTEATAAQMIGQRTNGVLGWLEAVGYDLRTEVQVLSPIKGGPAGTKSLNRMLQLTLNPRAAAAAATATGGAAAADAADAAAAGVAGPSLTSSGGAANSAAEGELGVWLGDTVVQLTNDYEKKVFNGDVGRVVSVFREGSAPRFRVEFETVGDIVGDGEMGGERDSDAPPPVVDYSKANLGKDVALSYAMTVRNGTRLGRRAAPRPIAAPHRSPRRSSRHSTGAQGAGLRVPRRRAPRAPAARRDALPQPAVHRRLARAAPPRPRRRRARDRDGGGRGQDAAARDAPRPPHLRRPLRVGGHQAFVAF
jgi:DNA replication protein DnaC